MSCPSTFLLAMVKMLLPWSLLLMASARGRELLWGRAWGCPSMGQHIQHPPSPHSEEQHPGPAHSDSPELGSPMEPPRKAQPPAARGMERTWMSHPAHPAWHLEKEPGEQGGAKEP